MHQIRASPNKRVILESSLVSSPVKFPILRSAVNSSNCSPKMLTPEKPYTNLQSVNPSRKNSTAKKPHCNNPKCSKKKPKKRIIAIKNPQNNLILPPEMAGVITNENSSENIGKLILENLHGLHNVKKVNPVLIKSRGPSPVFNPLNHQNLANFYNPYIN